MRQILLALYLGLSLTTVWATDETAASAVPATETAIQPGEAAAPVDLPAATPVAGMSAPPAPAEEESDQKKLIALQRNLVAQKMELFRNTIKNTEPKKNLFSRLLTSSQNPIDAELLAEMRRFAESHPELPETAEAYLLMAQVHQRIGEYPAAAIDLLLLRAAYPDSPFEKDAAKRLQALASDDLKKHADMLKAAGAKIASLKEEREERMVGLLRLLGEKTEKGAQSPMPAPRSWPATRAGCRRIWCNMPGQDRSRCWMPRLPSITTTNCWHCIPKAFCAPTACWARPRYSARTCRPTRKLPQSITS